MAAFLCLFATYTAVSLFSRSHQTTHWSRFAWLGFAAVVTGSGVWATHFVAMLAFRPNMPVGFDLGLTALSVAIAISISGLGFLIALDRRFAWLGGAMIGMAVAVMHYIGMEALLVPATRQWDPLYAHASIAIAVVLGALALWIGGNHPTIRGRFAAATVLVLAICGLHFTAMAAFNLTPDPRISLPQEVIAPQWLAVAIAAVTLLIIGFGLVGAVVDQHLAQRSAGEAERLRRYVVDLETTQRELELATNQLRTALEAAAAGSQAKSQFLAVMSHELRTPLNAIIGFSEMQIDQMYGPMGDDRYTEYSKHIYNSGKHLLGLINDVLDFSKLEAGRLGLHEIEIDVGKLIRDVCNLMKGQADKAGVTLVGVPPPDGLPYLLCDERRLRQVMLNLVSNAIKFTHTDGEIRISGTVRDGAIAITVADNGIGMSIDQLPTALESFGQIDASFNRTREGTGLGLPLSKRLVELHGGTLDIDSELGKGTTVTITFPGDRSCKAEVAA